MKSILQVLDRFNIPLGKWVGVPARLHWSWVLFFLLILPFDWATAIAAAGLIFIVLLHECGHCIAGKFYGCYIRDIVLYPFGGVAAMQVSERPVEELVIALAGPAVNVLLMPFLTILSDGHEILHRLALYNVVLLCFNLIPAFPMDGGRAFRALLACLLKNRLKATTIAVRISQGICICFGILSFILPNPFLLVIAILIFGAAEQELRAVAIQSAWGNSDVEVSARMLREIQERLARLDQRDNHA